MKKNKQMMDKIFMVVGVILVLYYLILKAAFGFIAFSNMFCLAGIILFIYGAVEVKFNLNIWQCIPLFTRKILKVLFIGGMAVFILLEGVIIYYGHHYDLEKPDYLVVLGAGLRGSELSTALLNRLETAVKYNEQYPEVKIVVSGGQGQGEYISEALAMKKYLVAHNIEEDQIIMEDQSTNTYENFLFTKEKLKELTGKDDYKITVVTNNFHMYRARYLGEQVGFQCLGYPAPAHISSTVVFHVREFFGVIKAYLFKR